jgi:8-oxo-dGTP diphosphatase
MTTFVTAAFCLLRGRHLLTVRKTGSTRFMLPGGKIDPGETPYVAALREVAEEVGVHLPDGTGTALGRFHDVAANEPGSWVDATVFVTPLDGHHDPSPRAEIAEQRWLDLDGPLPDDLAPLLRNHVVPALRAQVGAA